MTHLDAATTRQAGAETLETKEIDSFACPKVIEYRQPVLGECLSPVFVQLQIVFSND